MTQPKQLNVKELLSGGGKSIPLFKVFMSEDVLKPVNDTLMSGYIGQGPRVDAFEEALKPWVGSDHAVALSSGTAALQLALRLCNVGHGDEVISTAMTCTATNVVIPALGAKIVWADIDPKTGNIDPESIKKCITAKTKAIMMVHWGGYPCEIDEINAIGKQHGIPVIEDAAHAFGASYNGKPIGSHSDFVCFSFQAIKLLTTVDGGALVCKNKADYKRAKLLRWFGIDRETPRKDFRCEEDVKEYGYKFHMNDVNATIGLHQLPHVEKNLKDGQKNGDGFRERLKDIRGVELLHYKNDRKSSYWLFSLLADNRIQFMKAMEEMGIVVSQVHARNDSHTMFKEFRKPLPGVEAFSEKQVSIPAGWWLSDRDFEHIVKSVQSFYKA